MKDDKRGRPGQPAASGAASIPNRILGSLRDALAAASRDATGEITVGERTEILPKDRADPGKQGDAASAAEARLPVAAPQVQSAAEALREAKAPTRGHYEANEPTTRVVRGRAGETGAAATAGSTRTSGRARQAQGLARQLRSGSGGRLAGRRRWPRSRRLPPHPGGQQRHWPGRQPTHLYRFRRQHNLVRGAGLHPL